MRPVLRAVLPLAAVAPVLTLIAAALARRAGDGPLGVTISYVHLAIALVLYGTAGGRAVRAGRAGWIGGLAVAAIDAVIGHGGAFLFAPPPADPAAYAATLGRTPSADEIPTLQVQAAAFGALGAVTFGLIAGAVGGVVARRRAR